MEKKQEKLIICGQSGSGKDYLLSRLREEGFRASVKTTTRPKRSSEVDGVDYYFKTNEQFNTSDMVVHQKFYNHLGDEWLYGIDNKSFNMNNIFIMTPGEIKQISEDIRKECFVVYLDIDEDIRRNRLSMREDNNDSIERRIQADKRDFESFEDYDLKVSDPEFEVDMITSLMV